MKAYFVRPQSRLIPMRAYFIFIVGFLFCLSASAGGIKGRVIDEEGNPLPFTTIYVKETGSGSISNESGLYEVRLEPGTYTMIFQFLGYQTQQFTIQISETFTERDIVMLKQAFLLAEAQIKGGSEDPSYKIIRKAIAKSGFHRQQIETYTCEVYLKGGGRLVSVPWYLRKVLEDEGIDTAATFVTESVSKIVYQRPNQFKEEVISVRTSGDERDSNPMRFIGASFYEPIVAEGIISPLSPRAFSYYKFRYVSTFTDREYQVSKIEVIPRSKGEDVVAGMLYIVDGLWCIHSFEFSMVVQGIELNLRQVFAPVAENVWLPVTHKYDGTGKLLGVRFEFGYLASVSGYNITLNPDLSNEITVYDDKTEQDLIDSRENPLVKGKAKDINIAEEKLSKGEELTQKELRQLMKSYEKEQRKESEEPEVTDYRTFSIDSLAYKSDSMYWAERRPIPLTDSEVKGYKLQDSLYVEEKKEEAGDTLDTKKKKFSPTDILFGNTYKINSRDNLRIHANWTSINFNTVDGWNFEYKLSYYRRFDEKRRLEISPLYRYSFSRNKSFGKLMTEYRYRDGLMKGNITAEGGWYYSQFNADVPILPVFNSFSSLVFENNYMKVYDRNFVEARFKHSFNGEWAIGGKAAFDERIETFNTTSQTWFPVDSREYTPNLPSSPNLPLQDFGTSRAFKITALVEWKIGARYGKSDERYYERNSPPIVTVRYTRAVPNVWGSKPDIHFGAVNVKYAFKLSRLGKLNIRSEYGNFRKFENGEFIDFAHFMGNEMYFTRWGSMNGYSLLPYYQFSTARNYLSTYAIYEFRNFILGNIPTLRMLGVNESLLLNHLYTQREGHYVEVGYSITNLFRFGRVDFVSSFFNSGFREFKIQLGISSDIFSVD